MEYREFQQGRSKGKNPGNLSLSSVFQHTNVKQKSVVYFYLLMYYYTGTERRKEQEELERYEYKR